MPHRATMVYLRGPYCRALYILGPYFVRGGGGVPFDSHDFGGFSFLRKWCKLCPEEADASRRSLISAKSLRKNLQLAKSQYSKKISFGSCRELYMHTTNSCMCVSPQLKKESVPVETFLSFDQIPVCQVWGVLPGRRVISCNDSDFLPSQRTSTKLYKIVTIVQLLYR